jgi:hypothetical protein
MSKFWTCKFHLSFSYRADLRYSSSELSSSELSRFRTFEFRTFRFRTFKLRTFKFRTFKFRTFKFRTFKFRTFKFYFEPLASYCGIGSTKPNLKKTWKIQFVFNTPRNIQKDPEKTLTSPFWSKCCHPNSPNHIDPKNHRFKSDLDQGCQIFLDTIYQNWEKYTKWPQHYTNGHKIYVPNGHKIYLLNGRIRIFQLGIIYVYPHFPFKGTPKFTQIGILGLKIYHLATLTWTQTYVVRIYNSRCGMLERFWVDNNNFMYSKNALCYLLRCKTWQIYE